ncbi:MAG: hypothetical protein BJG00_011095 [Limnothrix sp. CACIAM 69d]|jgi:hypothetical protein|nr:MAG: hypothetical protein BJG00_011095 [Limnothrix sp. CACIAM 69d]
MSSLDRARALMTQRHHAVKHRHQSLLGRASVTMGLTADAANRLTHIQGKLVSDSYDRSPATMS